MKTNITEIKKHCTDAVHWVKNYKIDTNSPVFTYFVCIVIAFMIWLLNALGKEYRGTVSMKVNYRDIPEERILLSELPRRINVDMQAPGFTLLRYRMRLVTQPLDFNVSAFVAGISTSKEQKNFAVSTNDLIPKLSKQARSENTILAISPDTLYFEFDNIIEKKVPISADYQLEFKPQFFQSRDAMISPDSVLVRGPACFIDTLTSIPTKQYSFTNLDRDVKKKCNLEEIDGIEYDISKTEIRVPVSQFTQISSQIQLSTFNLPDTLKMVTFPSQVQVRCMVAMEDAVNVTKDNFILGVDYSDYDVDKKSLDVVLYSSPSFVKQIRFHPSEVEFIIQKK